MTLDKSQLLTGDLQHEDLEPHLQQTGSLRPQLLREFIGNHAVRRNLSVFISAAKVRDEALDHVLIYGPPGLGKTTLSQIIANEMGVGIKITSGPIISKAGDLAAILTNVRENEVLFIDEIHRLATAVEEMLYSAMEDFAIDIVIGEGPGARSVRLPLPRFTLIGATTRLGLLSNPFRDRFGIPLQLSFYQRDDLAEIISKYAEKLEVEIELAAAHSLALCSRGTPRIALRLLRRVRDFASAQGGHIIAEKLVKDALEMLEIDSLGLDKADYGYLEYLHLYHGNGPVGIETIAAGLAEDKGNLEESVEPYLLQIGFLNRTSRGRVLTQPAIDWIQEKLQRLGG